mmetsp:Transcript_26043/g.60468  ORF Transcript_26043/g.60468 Transcript_26043/m.60468 type:complete len:83 (+) Transcript_26043:2715-2963(+)
MRDHHTQLCQHNRLTVAAIPGELGRLASYDTGEWSVSQSTFYALEPDATLQSPVLCNNHKSTVLVLIAVANPALPLLGTPVC